MFSLSVAYGLEMKRCLWYYSLPCTHHRYTHELQDWEKRSTLACHCALSNPSHCGDAAWNTTALRGTLPGVDTALPGRAPMAGAYANAGVTGASPPPRIGDTPRCRDGVTARVGVCGTLAVPPALLPPPPPPRVGVGG